MVFLGAPMILLGEWLGASAFTIGMAYAALYLALPMQVIFTATLHRYGYKRQMIFCWVARALAIVVLAAVIWAAHEESPKRWMCCVFILCAWYFCLLRAAGNSATTPWMYAFIPPHIRGRYFAMDQTVSSTCGILVLISVSAVFAAVSTYHAFLICMAIALAGSIGSTACLTFWPDRPNPKPVGLKDMARRVPRLYSRKSPFRDYLIITTLFWLVISPINPFGSYYLKTEEHLSQSIIVLYSAFQYAGTLLGALWIGKRLDRWGVKPFFAVSLGLYALLGIYWAMLVLEMPFIVNFAAAAYFLFGLGNAFFYSPNLKYLPQVCPRNDQPLALALNIATTGMAAGLSPMIGGFFVKHVDGTPGMMKEPFLIYLAILVVAQFLLLAPFMRLKEVDNPEAPELPLSLGLHIRFPRYLSHILGVSVASHKLTEANPEPRD